MIESIVDGVIDALKNAFDYKVYTDDVKQGLTEPCFFIDLLTAERKNMIGSRYREDVSLDLVFVSESGESAATAKVASQLVTVLDVISLPGGEKTRRRQLSCQVENGVLHCLVDYSSYYMDQGTKTLAKNFFLNGKPV